MKKLRIYLSNNNLSIAQFAIIINRSRQAVNSWLSDKAKPDLESAVIIENITKGKVKPSDWF